MEHGDLTPSLRSLFLSRPEVQEIIKFDHKEILDQLVVHKKLVDLLAALEKDRAVAATPRFSIEVPIPAKQETLGVSKPVRDSPKSEKISKADDPQTEYRNTAPPGMEWKFDFAKNDYVLRKKRPW